MPGLRTVLRLALLAAALGEACWAATDPLSLQPLAGKAGFIFAGQVVAVQQPEALFGTVPTVRISMRVERAYRGVRRGQVFTFSEWAGASRQTYRRGQRLLLYLYPLSRSGLTSVVAGRLGRFAIDARGDAVIRLDQARTLQLHSSDRLPQRPLFQERHGPAGSPRDRRLRTYEP